MPIWKRFSMRDAGQVTGYAVALAGDVYAAGDRCGSGEALAVAGTVLRCESGNARRPDR